MSGDLRPDAPAWEPLLGCTDEELTVESATPITFVDNDDPPVLLMHGSMDDLVPWQQSAALFDAVTAAHGRAELVLVPRGGHGQASLCVPVGVEATLTSTADGTVTGPTPLFLDAEVLVDFFDRAFKNG